MTASEVKSLVEEMERTGNAPRFLTGKTLDAVSESLAKYFTDAGEAKIVEFTDKVQEVLEQAIKTEQEARPGAEATVTVGESPATSRGIIGDFLKEHTGDALPDALNLDFFLRIPQEVASGAGQFLAQNWDQERVDEWPALELVRVYPRDVPRGSEEDKAGPENGWDDDDGRWVAACEEAGDDDAARVFDETGRMIALKSSGVWQALGDGAGGYDDTLGNPFGPFAFNSGMDTDEVAYDDCVEMGLIGDGDEVEPAKMDLLDLIGELL